MTYEWFEDNAAITRWCGLVHLAVQAFLYVATSANAEMIRACCIGCVSQ